MKNDLVFKSGENNISGYKQITDIVYKLLYRNFNLFCLNLYDDQHSNYKSALDCKQKTFNKELVICPLQLNEACSWNRFRFNRNNSNLITMWETTRVPSICINQLNDTFNNVIVPCSWNMNSFQNSGVNNIKLLNLFVDDENFYYRPKINLNKFTFLAGANLYNYGLSHIRKNLQTIIDCFVKVFRGISDVELIIKCTSTNKNEIPYCLDERIKIIKNFLSVNEMCNLYVDSDVFISVSKSEGWGFFQIESLAVGRPVITVDYGGIKDFCNSSNSFFIDYKEELASGYWNRDNGMWAELNINSLCETMFWSYKNKDILRNNWRKYSQSVIPKFNLINFENRLLNLLN